MARFVVCPKFTRKTCYCSYYGRTIKPDDIHKEISCQGFPNRAREKWLLKAASKQENPYVQAEVLYQVLGEKTK